MEGVDLPDLVHLWSLARCCPFGARHSLPVTEENCEPVESGLLIAIVAGSICVLGSPIDYAKVDVSRLTGSVFKWQWVRWFSPFINLYALAFLAGGAIYSAWRYGKQQSSANRCAGNVLIAVGALLPGIGGSFTRFGHTEWLYVTELFALILIWLGYALIKNDPGPTIHAASQTSNRQESSSFVDIL
jgi:hypothetical protein